MSDSNDISNITKNENFKDLMLKAEEMRKSMQSAQERLMKTKIIGESGAEPIKVKATMNGRYELSRLEASEEAWKTTRSVFAELIIAAVNDAVKKVEHLSRDALGSLAKDFGIPNSLDGEESGGQAE